MSWYIEDWMGKHVFKDKEFNSYLEARDFINEYANTITTDETIHEGICEDLYAIEKEEINTAI